MVSPVLAGEAVVLGDLAAGRELAAELGDALGGAAGLDLLGEQRVAGGAVLRRSRSGSATVFLAASASAGTSLS